MAVEQVLSTNYGDDYYYQIRKRRKKNKRVRIIHAPSPKLKALQKDFADWFYKIKEREFKENPQVTGFLPGRSIGDNAKPHLNKDWVITMDVKDFFPTTGHWLVDKELSNLPQSKSPRYWFSKSKPTAFKGMRENDLVKVLMIKRKGDLWELPQGSPASPVLANYIGIKEIDQQVKSALDPVGFEGISYTRYADDITISFNGGERNDAKWIADRVKNYIEGGAYKIKEQKTDIKHKSQRQLVTGVVVNGENPRIERGLMNNMRAAIHNTKRDGKELSAEIKGMMSFIQSINKTQYDKLNKQLGD